eukprot:99033_1
MAIVHPPNKFSTQGHNAQATVSPPSFDDSVDAKENPIEHPSLGNTNYSEEKETGQRKIGKWYIKETLGKGGYSWVKRGIDSISNKQYALKFMERRKGKDGKLRKSQVKQVETEIEVLRRVGKSDNIIRLFAYNLNQRYPDRNAQQRSVILLVLEYCPGGELFDLVYYTDTLEPILARTYFHQLVAGMQCLHSKGVIHRDIKPQNLLLDQRYNLKITDFGLSRICDMAHVGTHVDVNQVQLRNPRVGTKGYQSPEIVAMNHMLKLSGKVPQDMYYNGSSDVFAMGVVLFILMTGYPPFKSAEASDTWYGYISNYDFLSFWRAHRNSGLKRKETDLITRMLLPDMEKRITILQILQHSWFTDEVLTSKQLTAVLTYRHHEVELKISMDGTKQAILQYSEKVNMKRPILPEFKERIMSKGYKLDRHPPYLEIKANMIHDVYTTANAYEVLQEIRLVLEDDMKGVLIDPKCNQIFDDEEVDAAPGIDIDNFCLTATIAYGKEDDEENMEFAGTTIHVQLYWDKDKECNLVSFKILSAHPTDSFEQKKKQIETWRKLKDAFLTKAVHVLTGLPEKHKEVVSEDMKALYAKCFPKKE